MKQTVKNFSLIVSTALLTSCGASIGAIPAGFPYGGNQPDAKATCSDLAQNAITVFVTSNTVPKNVIVSINQGKVLFDSCTQPAGSATSPIVIGAYSGGQLPIRIALWSQTALRNYYFGGSASPIRSDLQVYVASRRSCGDADQVLLSRDNAMVSWQMTATSTADCPSNPVNYQGTASF